MADSTIDEIAQLLDQCSSEQQNGCGCERSELSFSNHMKGVVVIQNGAKNRMNHEPSVNGDMVDLSNMFFWANSFRYCRKLVLPAKLRWNASKI